MDVVRYSPLLFFSAVGFSLVSTVLEGVGLSFILPIVELIQAGDGPGGTSEGVMYWFRSSYDVLGVPFTLGTVTLGVFLVMGVRFSTTFLAKWLTVTMSNDYVRHLQNKMFARSLDADVKYFDRVETKTILNAIVKQSTECRHLINQMMNLFFMILLGVIYSLIGFVLSPFLLLSAVVLLGGITIIFNLYFDSGEHLGDQIADANEEIQKTSQAVVQGIREVKLLGLQETLADTFESATETYAKSRKAIGRNKHFIENYYNLTTLTAVFGLVYLAYTFTGLVLSGMVLFLIAIFRFSPKVSAINSTYYDVMGYFPNLARSQAFISSLEPEENQGDKQLTDPVQTITLKNVHFSYHREPVLENISLELQKNRMTAIVGPSGAGKSTVASLLAYFYVPDEGRILINNDLPLSELDRESWWSYVSYVRQDPFIFNTTLRENLLFANASVSEDRLFEVMEDTLITEFFDDLEHGLDTELGDRGVRLSGGQCQRVALARSLLQPTEVMILDEATSALDYDLENKIYQNIGTYLKDKIILVIAHRLATVRQANEIHFIEDGKIIERGTHEELMKKTGAYYNLHQEQERNVGIT